MTIHVFGGRHTAADLSRWIEARVAQAERLEDVVVEVAVERLARHAPHHLTEQDEAGVAVLERGARRVVERHLRQQRGRLRKSGIQRAARRDRRQARAVREQPPDRDHVVRASAEFFEIPPERPVELDLTALDERHHGERRAERLRQRRDVEDRVLGHRHVIGHHAPRAPRAPIDDLVAAPEEDDDAGNLARSDRVDRGFVDAAPVLRRHAGRGQRERDEQDREDGGTERHDHALDLIIRPRAD